MGARDRNKVYTKFRAIEFFILIPVTGDSGVGLGAVTMVLLVACRMVLDGAGLSSFFSGAIPPKRLKTEP